MTCDKMAQTMAKHDKIFLPLQYWGLCLPHGHMISVHPWNRLSAFIPKYFMQNLKNSFPPNGPSMVRPSVTRWTHSSSHLATRRPRFHVDVLMVSQYEARPKTRKLRSRWCKINSLASTNKSTNKFTGAITGMIMQGFFLVFFSGFIRVYDIVTFSWLP